MIELGFTLQVFVTSTISINALFLKNAAVHVFEIWNMDDGGSLFMIQFA